MGAGRPCSLTVVCVTEILALYKHQIGVQTPCRSSAGPRKPKLWLITADLLLSCPRSLEPVHSAPLLMFPNITAAFGNFSKPGDWEKFFKRTSLYPYKWCCADQEKGSVFYDMWWDIPHVDRFGRTFEGEESWYAIPI